MKHPVYSIRDEMVGFGSPFVDINDASAKRNFAYAVNNNGDTMSFQPRDFSLYQLAEFDTETGKLEPLPCPALVVRADALVSEK